MVPINDVNGLPILDRDEHLRPGTDMQSLGALKPSFKEMGEMMPGFDAVAILKYPHLERSTTSTMPATRPASSTALPRC